MVLSVYDDISAISMTKLRVVSVSEGSISTSVLCPGTATMFSSADAHIVDVRSIGKDISAPIIPVKFLFLIKLPPDCY